MRKKIIIVTGDPNSINSEIIYKSWKKINNSLKKRIYLISNYDLMRKQLNLLKYNTKIVNINRFEKEKDSFRLKILNVELSFKNPFKVGISSSSKYVKSSLDLAHKFALKKEVAGIINCSINKNLLGNNKMGVTEYLARKCKIKNNSEVMLISNKYLSVSPITTHIDIKDISKKISSKSILTKVKVINNWFIKKFKKKPKIGILGLNPHNAEMRKNSEEVKTIIPTILKIKKSGIKISGPLVSDTLFIKDYNKYDVIIGMYHDQVITPFKTLFKFDAINITLGLKYLRVSPDHGTAVNIIRKKKADPKSLISCINFIDKFGK